MAEVEYMLEHEVAELLRVPRARVRFWRKKGLIPTVRPPGTRLILYPRAAVLAWIAGEPSQGPGGSYV